MNKTYRHPLDYALGLKHYVTEERLSTRYKPGPETFYVKEIINEEKIKISEKGDYLVLKLLKKGVDTLTAIRILAQQLRIPPNNILFLGFKDRDAYTEQYVFIKKLLVPEKLRTINKIYTITDNIAIKTIGYTTRKPTREVLLGNYFTLVFEIKEHDKEKLEEMICMIRDKLPSYYGYQRFGTKRPNSHLLGKYLILGRIDLFLHELLHDIYPREERNTIIARILTEVVPRKLLYENIAISGKIPLSRLVERIMQLSHGIFINAYQSYLYNVLLSKFIDEYGLAGADKLIPVLGCKDSIELYHDILVEEMIPNISEDLIHGLRCWYRRGLFSLKNIKIRYTANGKAELSFFLETGLYASIVMRELFKENLIL